MPDEAAVHDLVDQLVRSWNAGDADAYANLFTTDADYVTFFGRNLPGRDAIEKAHRHLFDGPLKGSRLTGMDRQDRKIRFIRPDVALVVAAGGSSVAGTEAEPGRESTVTLVALRDGETWLFTAFQNTCRSAPGGDA